MRQAVAHIEQPKGAERENLYLAARDAECMKQERNREQRRRQMFHELSSFQSGKGYKANCAEQKDERAGANGCRHGHPQKRDEWMADEYFCPAQACFFVQKDAARRMRPAQKFKCVAENRPVVP